MAIDVGDGTWSVAILDVVIMALEGPSGATTASAMSRRSIAVSVEYFF